MFPNETESHSLEKQILDKAEALFLSYGYANTTTGQIATELGISKKTLYKTFSSKESILFAILNKRREWIEDAIRLIISNEDLSFVEKVSELAKTIGTFTASMPLHLLREIERIKPGWKRYAYDWSTIERFFDEGRNLGYVRSDINPKFLITYIRLSIETMNAYAAAHPEEFSQKDVFELVPHVFLEGCLTEKGQEISKAYYCYPKKDL